MIHLAQRPEQMAFAGFFAIINMLSKTGFGALMILFLDITTGNWYDLLPE